MLLLIVGLALSQQQQHPVRLVDRPCAGCHIVINTVAVLKDPQGTAELSRVSQVVRDGAGRYWLVPGDVSVHVSVFSADGLHLRNVGQRGSGPGEFRMIYTIAPAADGIEVFDALTRTGTRFNLDFKHAATRRLDFRPESVVLRPDGSAIVAAVVPIRESIGFTLHEIDSRGRRVRSFAKASIPYREDLRPLFTRTLTSAHAGSGYVVAHRLEYMFAVCPFVTDACRTFVRSTNWFPRPNLDSLVRYDGQTPPASRLVAVSTDSPDFAWAITWVADKGWKSAVRRPGPEYSITDYNRYYDTILERIDLRSGHVVATTRRDEAIKGFIAPSTVWHFRETADGQPEVEVQQVRM